jgi:dihydrodipicolinate synthase/N-acetylneuraminate lyase
MEKVKMFTLKEHLDAIEVAYSIGIVNSLTRPEKKEMIAILKKAVIKYVKVINNKSKN